MKVFVRWAVSLLLVLTASNVFGKANFTSTVTFGDSFTHNDSLGSYFGSSQKLYGKDPMEAVFSKASGNGARLTNYAVGGSLSDDLEVQIDAYEAARTSGTQHEGSLFSIEIGVNDILLDIPLLATVKPGKDDRADAITSRLVNNIHEGYRRLRKMHPHAQFILWTIPDVTLTPKYWSMLPEKEIRHIRAHIEKVNTAIRELSSQKTLIFDLYRWMTQQTKAPPDILGRTLRRPPASGCFQCLYADEIHPTAVTNALAANAMIARINTAFKDAAPRYMQQELAELAHIKY